MQSLRFIRAQAFCLCLLFLFGFLSQAHAGEFPVSGSHEFVRYAGSPTPQAIEFPAPVAGNYYLLRIRNGEDANAPVTAGWVSLNGSELFSPRDFRKSVRFLEAPVALDTQNVLSVKLAGKPGSGLRAEVIGIDNDAPEITAAIDPTANAAGWHNTNATVTFTCSDGLSGIESCSDPQVVNGEGADQPVTGTAVDKAGNSAETQVTVSLDKTPPEITTNISPEANAAGWHNSAVTLSYQCSDALSGIAACPETRTLTDDGADQQVIEITRDLAGNSVETQGSVSLDQTPPQLTAQITPPANQADWHREAVTITYLCEDTLSGVATCPDLQPVGDEGADQAFDGSAADIAGNTTELQSTVHLDLTPPEITAELSSPANSAGWHNVPVTVSYQCNDALSGIDNCPEPEILVGDGEGLVVGGSVEDLAGNSASTQVSVNLDQAPPEISFVSPANGSLVREPQPQLKLLLSDNLALDDDSLIVSVAGDSITGCSIDANIATCTLPQPLSSDVEIALDASVLDLAGNTGEASITTAIDTDGDSVADYADQCPETSTTQSANAQGCALEQLDSDSDGVNDAEEIAAGTDPEDATSFPPVTIETFAASPANISSKGQRVELRWRVSGAAAIEIRNDTSGDPQTGLESQGTLALNPQLTTNYTLKATGPGGDTSETLAVTLDLPPPPDLWTTPTVPVQEQIATSLAVAADGSAYVGAFDGNFYKVNPSGQVEWTLEDAGLVMGKAAISEGRIIFGANISGSGHLENAGRVYAIRADKTLLWNFDTEGAVVAGPILSADKTTAYIATYTGKIYALNTQNGGQLWQFQLPENQEVTAAPALNHQKLIVNTEGKQIFALDIGVVPANERILWSRNLE